MPDSRIMCGDNHNGGGRKIDSEVEGDGGVAAHRVEGIEGRYVGAFVVSHAMPFVAVASRDGDNRVG